MESELYKVINTNQVLIRYLRKDQGYLFREIKSENSDNSPTRPLFEKITTKGEPFGALVAVAIPKTDTFCVGASVCCKRDLFGKEFGRETAFERAVFNAKNLEQNRKFGVPDSVLPEVINFIRQAKKYFQDKKYVHVLDIDESLLEEDILAEV